MITPRNVKHNSVLFLYLPTCYLLHGLLSLLAVSHFTSDISLLWYPCWVEITTKLLHSSSRHIPILRSLAILMHICFGEEDGTQYSTSMYCALSEKLCIQRVALLQLLGKTNTELAHFT